MFVLNTEPTSRKRILPKRSSHNSPTRRYASQATNIATAADIPRKKLGEEMEEETKGVRLVRLMTGKGVRMEEGGEGTRI